MTKLYKNGNEIKDKISHNYWRFENNLIDK